MDFLAAAGPTLDAFGQVLAQAEHETEFQINVFWIVAQAGSFLLFLVIVYLIAFRRIGGILEERRSRIEQGLKDADQARVERDQAASERLAVLADARQQSEDILTRAQKVADETRERDLTETRAQIDQMRERAAADIAAERDRALADVRSQVAELALLAASRVVGETMNDPRERRLVEEFVSQLGSSGTNPQARN